MRKQIEELVKKYNDLEEQQHHIVEHIFNVNCEYEECLERIRSLRKENDILKEDLDSCRYEKRHLEKLLEDRYAEISMLNETIKEMQKSYGELCELVYDLREFNLSSFLRKKGVRLDEYYGVIGVLFADYDRIPVKEYIADHLMLVNSRSADYIDFLLPGYYTDAPYNDKGCIVDNVSFDGKQLYFDKETFSRSVLAYRKIFGLDYLDRPVLILHELNNSRISSRRIILELDYKEVKELFNKIIDIAKQHTDISEFSSELQKKYLFCMFPKFLKLLISYFFIDVDEVGATIKDARRFHIKGK